MRANNINFEMNEVHLTSKLTFSLIDDAGNHIENVEIGGIHNSLPSNPTAEDISYLIEQHMRSKEVAIAAKTKAVTEFKALQEAIIAVAPVTVAKTPVPVGYVSLEKDKVEVGETIKGRTDSDNVVILRYGAVANSVPVVDKTFTITAFNTPVVFQVAKANKFMDVSDDRIEVEVIEKKVEPEVIEPVLVVDELVPDVPVLDIATAVPDEG